MKNVSRVYFGGFTLIELLIVVLIIGILSAVVMPMYQGAVDKSRFSTLLPAAKSIKNAEESVMAATGNYTDNMEDLEVNMDNEELNFSFDVHNNLADPSLFRIRSPKLENVRLASYFDHNPKFAGQMHCEAKTGDDRANRLCGKLLSGQELTENNGYTGYLLNQDITQEICDNAQLVWSNKQSSCYKTEEDRCTANGMPYENGFCGYKNNSGKGTGDRLVIEEGGTCEGDVGTWSGCKFLQINEGGVCISHSDGTDGNQGSCKSAAVTGGTIICEGGSSLCGFQSTFDGGICVGNANYNCYNSKFTNGSICYANGGGACGDYNYKSPYYDETSCCCGKYCHKDSPKCDASRCDPQYMK